MAKKMFNDSYERDEKWMLFETMAVLESFIIWYVEELVNVSKQTPRAIIENTFSFGNVICIVADVMTGTML